MSDPRPTKPEKPLPSDCCETGCDVCVFTRYSDEYQQYKQELEAWEERQTLSESE